MNIGHFQEHVSAAILSHDYRKSLEELVCTNSTWHATDKPAKEKSGNVDSDDSKSTFFVCLRLKSKINLQEETSMVCHLCIILGSFLALQELQQLLLAQGN